MDWPPQISLMEVFCPVLSIPAAQSPSSHKCWW